MDLQKKTAETKENNDTEEDDMEDDMDDPRKWRFCHKDRRIDSMLSVYHEISSESPELQKKLYPSWIRRTTNYFKEIEPTMDVPKEIKVCLELAKSVVENNVISSPVVGSNE